MRPQPKVRHRNLGFKAGYVSKTFSRASQSNIFVPSPVFHVVKRLRSKMNQIKGFNAFLCTYIPVGDAQNAAPIACL